MAHCHHTYFLIYFWAPIGNYIPDHTTYAVLFGDMVSLITGIYEKPFELSSSNTIPCLLTSIFGARMFIYSAGIYL
jgi:hypothetical protein